MISCRYVGGDASEIGDREFDTVGQKASLSETGYREAVLGGAAFIPESSFDKLGFSQDELDSFGPVGMRMNPPASFCDKLMVAQELFREIRSEMIRDSAGILVEASDENVR